MLFIAGGLILLLLIVVLVTPAILTSGWAEQKASATASEILGRPVTIEGIAFGWRTPLTLDRIEIPAIEGEDDRPLFDLEGVEVPLTLTGVLRMPPYALDEIRVHRVEVNAVRLEDGEWNVIKIADGMKKEPEAPEPPKEEKPSEAAPLPISSLKIAVDEIDLRAVDLTRDYVAGWEGGSLSVLWPGDVAPVTIDVDGTLRSGEETMPWDVRAKIEHWIDSDGMLTPMTTVATTASDGMVHAGQIAAGGFFLHADATGAEPIVARIVIPLRRWAELAQPGLPPDAFVPRMDGELELALNARHAKDFQKWDVEASVATHDVVAAGAPLGPAPQTIPNLTASLSAAMDLSERRVDELSATFDSPALQMLAEGGDLAFDDPAHPGRFEAHAHADFEKLWMLGASFISATNDAGLTGTMDFTARLLPPGDAEHRVFVSLDVSPGALTTLAPFAETPTALPFPLDLSPFATKTSATLALNPAEKLFSVPTFGVAAPLYYVDGSAEANLAGETPVWKTALAAGFDLDALNDSYNAILAQHNVHELQGRIVADVSANGAADGSISTKGSVTSRDIGAAIPRENGLLPIRQSEVVANWDLTADPAAKAIEIRNAALRSPLASLDVKGNASPTAIDLAGKSKTSLGPIMALAQQFKELPIDLAGRLEMDFDAKGEIGRDLQAHVSLFSFGPVRYTQMGTDVFSEDLHFETGTRVRWNDGELESVDIDGLHALLGDAMSASLDSTVNLGDGTGATASGHFAGTMPFLIAFVPPEKMESMEMALDATGMTTATVTIDAPLALGDDGLKMGERWVVKGNLSTDVPEMEWYKGDMGEYLAGTRDDRDFTVTLNPNDPMGFVYEDSAVTATSEVMGPMDIQMGEVRIENSTRFEMNKPILVNIPASRIGAFVFPTETMEMRLPPTTFAGKLKIEMERSDFIANDVVAVIEGVGNGGGSGNFNWGDFSWSMDSTVDVSDIRNLTQLVQLDEEMMGRLPELHGKAQATTKLRGSDPRPPYDLARGLPVRGSATLDWGEVAVRSGEAWWVEGIAGNASFDASDDGKNAALAWNLGIDEIGADAIEQKPVRDFAVNGSLELDDFDVLQLTVPETSVGNYEMLAGANFRAEGLKPYLLEGAGTDIESWLRGPRLLGDAKFHLDLDGLNETHPLLTAGGTIDWSGKLSNTPGRLLEFNSLLSTDSVDVAFADLFALNGLNGSWDALKTYRLDSSVRIPTKPTEGKFTVDRIAFKKPPAEGEILDSVVTVQGFERGLRMSAGIRDFLGGPATASASLTEEGSDPVLRAEMELTGLRGGKLSPYLRDLGGCQDEISGVATMTWRIPESSEGNVLDTLLVRLRSTQIGKKALARLLQALDANQDDPRFQNAITALNFGAPVGGQFVLENSLVTMAAQLRLPVGVIVPLPILDRAPLGEIFAVYGMQQQAGAISRAHDPLLMLLRSDLFIDASQSTEAGTLP
ncbi:hypothetical protein KQI84_16250 [bacterium]|nr:hypothetical protein [bacterium]